MNDKDARTAFKARVAEIVDAYWDCRDLKANDNTKNECFFNSPKQE